MLLNCLNTPEKRLIEEIFSLAIAKGFRIFLVGGTVRNILLGKGDIKDIDFAVEEDKAFEIADLVKKKFNGEIIRYKNFNNAKLIISNGTILDFVSTRTESYRRNGVLPKINKGTIKDDLKRRDFTINAMALTIIEGKEKLLDFFNGLKDLQDKKIRILHRKSFSEDPTRIIRAARFECRLGFQLEKETAVILKQTVQYICELTPERLRTEFIKILKDDNPEQILKMLDSWNAIHHILPGIKLDGLERFCLNDLQKYYSKKNSINICLIAVMLIYWFSAVDVEDVLKVRILFSNKEKRTVHWLVENKYLINSILSEPQNFSLKNLYFLLNNTNEEIEVFLYCLIGDNNKHLLKKIQKARNGPEIPINGNDVLLTGFTSGPYIGEILKLLEQEVIEGNIKSKSQALKWLEGMKKKC